MKSKKQSPTAKAISIPYPIQLRPCGFRIARQATANMVLGATECAYVTYTWRPAGAAVTGVVAPPAGVYWGPGDTVRATLPGGASTVAVYEFAGGVVFRNCPSGFATAG